MNVKVQCIDTYEINVQITAEAKLGEWKEIVKRVNASWNNAEPVEYYGPLHELLKSIDAAIGSVEAKEAVKPKPEANQATQATQATQAAQDATAKQYTGWWCHRCGRVVAHFYSCPGCSSTEAPQSFLSQQATNRCDRCGRVYAGAYCGSCAAEFRGQAAQGIVGNSNK